MCPPTPFVQSCLLLLSIVTSMMRNISQRLVAAHTQIIPIIRIICKVIKAYPSIFCQTVFPGWEEEEQKMPVRQFRYYCKPCKVDQFKKPNHACLHVAFVVALLPVLQDHFVSPLQLGKVYCTLHLMPHLNREMSQYRMTPDLVQNFGFTVATRMPLQG